jgi:hypothetical protein
MLGDNSILSGDGRAWDLPVNLPGERLVVEPGKVPQRFLLGKAFFVYWPAGLSLPGRIDAPDVVPNFGQMRLIR